MTGFYIRFGAILAGTAAVGAALFLGFGDSQLHWLFRLVAGAVFGLILADPLVMSWLNYEIRRLELTGEKK